MKRVGLSMLSSKMIRFWLPKVSSRLSCTFYLLITTSLHTFAHCPHLYGHKKMPASSPEVSCTPSAAETWMKQPAKIPDKTKTAVNGLPKVPAG